MDIAFFPFLGPTGGGACHAVGDEPSTAPEPQIGRPAALHTFVELQNIKEELKNPDDKKARAHAVNFRLQHKPAA